MAARAMALPGWYAKIFHHMSWKWVSACSSCAGQWTWPGPGAELYTKCLMSLLTIGWVVLLITVSGVQQQTWFLIAIGALGMAHTVFVAGQPRSPSAFGIPSSYVEYILEDDVMGSLRKAEERHPGIGRSLLQTFFPGDLRDQDDVEYWAEMRQTEHTRRKALEE
ncbi:MAG: hypothetical protein M1828_003920 [Chrysothrix sp. TS-e1954]|nr:MAG: hypothetical protein M1828_003920 [Chrysothrix sp. TS-e1954]